jgi:hypothetical protein
MDHRAITFEFEDRERKPASPAKTICLAEPPQRATAHCGAQDTFYVGNLKGVAL